MYKKEMLRLLLLFCLLLGSCTKDEMVCGTVTDGRIDYVNYMHYLEIDGKSVYVSEFTYNSYRAGEWVCLE